MSTTASTNPFIYYPTVERFFVQNEKKVRQYIYNNSRTISIDDAYQFLAACTQRYNTLERYNPTRASFETYWARHLNNVINTYKRDNKNDTAAEYVEAKDSSVEDAAYVDFELHTDFMKWLAKLKNCNKQYFQIMRLTLKGKSRKEIASRFHVSTARICQIISELKISYKAYLTC
jgi:RNA polymerase sigma factor (sigma-70 family)